jgi:hypothetical protein
MATTTNYAWTTPDNSGLVKNGAQDIRTLGSAVDTALWNSGYGQAGKNKIINGDFGINQRGFTSTTTATTFGHDRWRLRSAGGTATYSTQAFTAGTAPVVGYEGTNFARLVTSGQSGTNDYASIEQPIEDVRTFAGQTVTVSFWAKASTGTPNVGLTMQQFFGSGGSAVTYTSPAVKPITASWARYSFNVTVPSVSGKTITTSSSLSLWLETSVGTAISAAGFAAVGIQNVTIDIWGVQVEYGSTATPFQTATGTIQGELSACQRYYYRHTAAQNNTCFGVGMNQSTTAGNHYIKFATTMRTAPTSVDFSTLQISDYALYGAAITTLAIVGAGSGVDTANLVSGGASGMTSQLPSFLRGATAGTSYIAFSAEL